MPRITTTETNAGLAVAVAYAFDKQLISCLTERQDEPQTIPTTASLTRLQNLKSQLRCLTADP